MIRKYLFILAFSLFGLSNAFAQNQPFSRMDVFDLQWVQDPQISPDGDQIVYVRRGMDIMKDRRMASLWIINADGSHHQKLTSRTENESNPAWSPSGDRIAFTSSEEDHGSELFIYWVDSGKIAQISQLERSPGGLSWSPDGKKIAFSMKVPESNPTLVKPPSKPDGAEWADAPRVTTRLDYEQDGAGYIEPGFSHLFVVNADGGAVRQLTHDDYHHDSQPIWTPDGENLLFSANRRPDWERNYRNSEIYSLSVESGEITELTDRNGPDYSPAISPDGETIAYLGYEDRVQTYQVTKLWLMDRDGSNHREVQTGLDRSLSDISWNSNGDGLYFMYDDIGVTKIGYTDLNGDADVVAQNIGGTSIGRPYGGGSYSISNDDKIAFNQTSAYYPAELAVVEMGDEAGKITSLNEPLLSHRDLGEVEEVWYQSSVDGIDIQGWIVKPPNYDPDQTYPLLVENHGGPISNYGVRFSPEVQLYAADGYVVFYPNPRGSTGYGEEFGNLLYHDYPGDDYQDVMDGVTC